MHPVHDYSAESLSRRRLFVLFVIYLVFLLILTVSPFEFSIQWLKLKMTNNEPFFPDALIHFQISDIFINILLFLPFGGFLAFWCRTKRFVSGWRTLFIPVFFGGLLSASIEIAQLFLDRSTSIIDILANTSGTVLGYVGLWQWLWDRLFSKIAKWMSKHFRARLAVVFLYFIVLAGMMVLPLRMTHLKDWDETYPLIIGNEATLNRPWEGKIDQVVIYDRVLSGSEIRNLYQSEPGASKIQERRWLGSVVHYHFDKFGQDTIRDLSGNSGRLDLISADSMWHGNKPGIYLQDGQCLKSIQPAQTLTQTIRKTSQFSVEVWLQTNRLDQSGPARIISLSKNPGVRNFTLGQEGKDIHFRVRTRAAGWNGSYIHLVSRSVLRDEKMHHLVATFHYGVAKLFVDGVIQKEFLRSNWDHLPFIFLLGQNPVSKIAFCFMLFFPLSAFFYGLFRKARMIQTVVSIGILVCMIDMIYYIFLGQPFSVFIIITVMIIALSGGYTVNYWLRSGDSH